MDFLLTLSFDINETLKVVNDHCAKQKENNKRNSFQKENEEVLGTFINYSKHFEK